MFEVKEVREKKVTLIDPDNDELHVITDFLGRNQYGEWGKLGVYFKDFPDSLDPENVDLDGWEIVVTDYEDSRREETRTISGIVMTDEHRSDGSFIWYDEA